MKGEKYIVYTATAQYEGRDLDDCLYHLQIWAKAFRTTIKCVSPLPGHPGEFFTTVLCSMDAGAEKINWR